MDIHKPKPIRNWREFLKEVGTIVLGVCIALAAEQGVEWWHWRRQVTQAREVIATEMSRNVAGGFARLRIEQCIERRLDTLAQILDAASAGGRLPPVGDIGQTPPRSWNYGAWDSLVASQTAVHFPREELALLATAYNAVRRVNEWSPIETQAWTDLNAISGPGRRLDASSEAELRKALGSARTVNRATALIAVGLIHTVDSLHLPFSQNDLERIDAARRSVLSGEKATARNPLPVPSLVCQPIGAIAPSHYGQGLYSYWPGLIDQSVKTLPEFKAR